MEIDGTSFPEIGENSSTFSFGDDDEDNNNGSSSSSNSEVEDLLSSLPDALLVEILSLIPINSAASTSVLSRRWRHLWTHVTRLCFSHQDLASWRSFERLHQTHELWTTVDHIFRQLTSPKIDTFRLDIQFTLPVDQRESFGSSLQSWIRDICSRNVQEIKVCVVNYTDGCLIPLPTRVFETHSLVVLKLHGGFDYKLLDKGTISLPNLKKLSMNLGDRCPELMRLLFKSCPLLEDLFLYVDWEKDDHFVDVSAHNLKHFTIYIEGRFAGSQFRIDAPGLEVLKISTSCLSSHCFVRDLKGLLNVEITVEWGWDDLSDKLDEISELVHGVSSVRSLRLSSYVVDSLSCLHDGALPIFHNLTHLTTILIDPHGWSGLLRLLQCSPNLEVLVVHPDLEGECNTECMDWTPPNSVHVCLLNKLKRIEVEGLQGCQKDLDFLGYFLSNANLLERLHLSGFNYFDQGELCKELKFCEDLFSCPRSSVVCEIEVRGEFLKASSKGFNETAFDCQIYRHVPVCNP